MRISSRRLGEFLVARRVLSRDALDELLARESADGIDLSTLLEVEHIVSEHDLMAAVASELGVPFADLSEQSILPEIWGMVPEDLARGYLAVALERRPTGLVVAMDDPGDEQIVSALEADLGMTVLPAAAVREELQRLVEQMYGPGAEPARDQGPAPAVATRSMRGVQLDDLLDEVVRVGGSDLHLTVGSPPVVRVEGEMFAVEFSGLTAAHEDRIVEWIFRQETRQD